MMKNQGFQFLLKHFFFWGGGGANCQMHSLVSSPDKRWQHLCVDAEHKQK